MAGIFVPQDSCLRAPYGTRIYTQGLATCAGVIAYGLPADNNTANANKVLAHVSVLGVDAVMGQFVQTVRSSGMTLYGICLSLPDPAYNDHRDTEVIDMLSASGRYQRNQITPALISQQKAALKTHIQNMNTRVRQYCAQLNISITTLGDRPRPYGSMEATASNGGVVKAEGHVMERIPDVPAPAPKAGGGDDRRSRGGHSGTMGGGHSGGTGHRGSAPAGGHTGGTGYRGSTSSGGRPAGGNTTHKTTSTTHKTASSSKTGRR